jgi:lipoyl(octanoyl) transferase
MKVVNLGRRPYAGIEEAMRQFTAQRLSSTPDELWLVEHDPVFTQGVAGREQHLLMPGDIPVVRTARGGQVTYHGPGQVVAYPLVDLRRLGIYVKEYVFRLETAVLQTLAELQVTGHRVRGAPGIYVRIDNPFDHAPLVPAAAPVAEPQGGASVPLPDPFEGLGKLAALGIKVSNHCAYHGVAVNVRMDLEPFTRINPCGYAGLQTVDLYSLGIDTHWDKVADVLCRRLVAMLSP